MSLQIGRITRSISGNCLIKENVRTATCAFSFFYLNGSTLDSSGSTLGKFNVFRGYSQEQNYTVSSKLPEKFWEIDLKNYEFGSNVFLAEPMTGEKDIVINLFPENILFVQKFRDLQTVIWHWNWRSQQVFDPHRYQFPRWLWLDTVFSLALFS